MNIKILSLDNSSDYVLSYKEISVIVSPDEKFYKIVKLIKAQHKEVHNATNQKIK